MTNHCHECGDPVPGRESFCAACRPGSSTTAEEKPAPTYRRGRTRPTAEGNRLYVATVIACAIGLGMWYVSMRTILTYPPGHPGPAPYIFLVAAIACFTSLITMYVDLLRLDGKLLGLATNHWVFVASLFYIVGMPAYVVARYVRVE